MEILEKDLEVLKTFYPLNEKTIRRLVKEENYLRILDQIAYRFSKFQDTLGRLIKLYLLLKGEIAENLPLIDAINLINKYGFPIEEELWWELRNLRNSVSRKLRRGSPSFKPYIRAAPYFEQFF